eukprot:m.609906 g.609906  ORF g.609906 m.609906 type:complete len:99 (-) comp58129_c0_seq25:3887-4183(-)
MAASLSHFLKFPCPFACHIQQEAIKLIQDAEKRKEAEAEFARKQAEDELRRQEEEKRRQEEDRLEAIRAVERAAQEAVRAVERAAEAERQRVHAVPIE